MDTLVITGVSRGIGRAVAEKFLEEGFRVIGIGRKSTIQHDLFSFIRCDLSNQKQVENIHINLPEQGKIILINNAGLLGPVKRLSQQSDEDLTSVFQVNVITPMLLCRKFAKMLSPGNKLIVLNISSGAARRPIPSWAAYCASKAALDMFSESFQLEENELGRETTVFSLAPGVIDTDMQLQIRSTLPSHFSSLKQFQQLKQENNLKKPAAVAVEIYSFLLNPPAQNVVCRL